jgi:hypothetical protein
MCFFVRAVKILVMMVAMWTRTIKGTLEHPTFSNVALDPVVYMSLEEKKSNEMLRYLISRS